MKLTRERKGTTQLLAEKAAPGLCTYSHGVLTVRGALQRNQLGLFNAYLDRLVESPLPKVLMDFRGCQYLSSLFIGMLVDRILEARKGGKQVVVLVSPSIGQFFQLAQLHYLFDFTVVQERVEGDLPGEPPQQG